MARAAPDLVSSTMDIEQVSPSSAITARTVPTPASALAAEQDETPTTSPPSAHGKDTAEIKETQAVPTTPAPWNPINGPAVTIPEQITGAVTASPLARKAIAQSAIDALQHQDDDDEPGHVFPALSELLPKPSLTYSKRLNTQPSLTQKLKATRQGHSEESAAQESSVGLLDSLEDALKDDQVKTANSMRSSPTPTPSPLEAGDRKGKRRRVIEEQYEDDDDTRLQRSSKLMRFADAAGNSSPRSDREYEPAQRQKSGKLPAKPKATRKAAARKAATRKTVPQSSRDPERRASPPRKKLRSLQREDPNDALAPEPKEMPRKEPVIPKARITSALVSMCPKVGGNENYRKFLSRFGVKIIDKVPTARCQFVCITQGDERHTTEKILRSIAMGKPIVSEKWVEVSYAASRLQDHGDYIHEEIEAAAGTKRLDFFIGKTFFFTKALVEHYGDGWESIGFLARDLGVEKVIDGDAAEARTLRNTDDVFFFGCDKDDSDAVTLIDEQERRVYRHTMLSESVLSGKLQTGSEYQVGEDEEMEL